MIPGTPPISLSFDLHVHLIGRKVNNQAAISTFDSKKKRKSYKKYSGTYFALRVIQIGELVQLDAACS